MGLKVYVDGEYFEKDQAKVSVYDHGLLYGDGVFEGIRSYGGHVFRLDAHINRLYNSAKAIMLSVPATTDEMKKIVTDSITINALPDAYIRLLVTRGPGDLGLGPERCPSPSVICIVDSIALYPKELYEKGLEVVTASTRRIGLGTLYPQVKSLNYLNSILAKMEAQNAGSPEAIMLNSAGTVAECTADNIFIVKDARLITPDVNSGILEGVTRAAVMELALIEGIPVQERTVSRYEIFTADECFLTGSAAEVIPVVKVDQRTIGDGKPGPMTMLLHEKFRELVSSEGA